MKYVVLAILIRHHMRLLAGAGSMSVLPGIHEQGPPPNIKYKVQVLMAYLLCTFVHDQWFPTGSTTSLPSIWGTLSALITRYYSGGRPFPFVHIFPSSRWKDDLFLRWKTVESRHPVAGVLHYGLRDVSNGIVENL
jgi:hypothetical protein